MNPNFCPSNRCSSFWLSKVLYIWFWCCKKQFWSTKYLDSNFVYPLSVCTLKCLFSLRCMMSDLMLWKVLQKYSNCECGERAKRALLIEKQSEQALRRSYQNLARSANLLLVLIMTISRPLQDCFKTNYHKHITFTLWFPPCPWHRQWSGFEFCLKFYWWCLLKILLVTGWCHGKSFDPPFVREKYHLLPVPLLLQLHAVLAVPQAAGADVVATLIAGEPVLAIRAGEELPTLHVSAGPLQLLLGPECEVVVLGTVVPHCSGQPRQPRLVEPRAEDSVLGERARTVGSKADLAPFSTLTRDINNILANIIASTLDTLEEDNHDAGDDEEEEGAEDNKEDNTRKSVCQIFYLFAEPVLTEWVTTNILQREVWPLLVFWTPRPDS